MLLLWQTLLSPEMDDGCGRVVITLMPKVRATLGPHPFCVAVTLSVPLVAVPLKFAVMLLPVPLKPDIPVPL